MSRYNWIIPLVFGVVCIAGGAYVVAVGATDNQQQTPTAGPALGIGQAQTQGRQEIQPVDVNTRISPVEATVAENTRALAQERDVPASEAVEFRVMDFAAIDAELDAEEKAAHDEQQARIADAMEVQRSRLAASLDQAGVTSVEGLVELEKLLDVLLLSPHRMDAEAKKNAEEAIARLVAMGDTVIPTLMARFNRQGQDSGFRHRAVKVLQAIGTPAAQKALLEIALAKDQEFMPSMKEWAASAFIATLDNKSEAARLLESDEDHVHNAGLRAIAGQSLDAALLERVAKLLASDNHTVRGNAAKVMSKDPSTAFVQAKVDALISAIGRAHTFPKADDTYQNTYFTYAEMEVNTYIRALSEMAGAPGVMRYRRPTVSGVQRDALTIAAGMLGDASVLSDVRAILSDPEKGMMRLWAAGSIARIGTEQDIALLQTIAETDTVVRQYYPSIRPPDADQYYPVRHAAQSAINQLKASLQKP
ncbi:MAG TPA: hypothetical protein VMX13_05545 [Sedimentisphaerales bacterium]|nr:hypothetical protein [Sedimentisphaerales bacterium]